MDIKTIKHISLLARIGLNDKEEELMKTELSSIIDYIRQLERVDTEKVDPLYQVTGLVDSVRGDEPAKVFEMDEELNEKLVGQAPGKEKRFMKVKSVFNK